MFIKTTNVVELRETTNILRKVQCPYCRGYFEHIPEYVTSMICWNHECKKEFRIEKDMDKCVPHKPGIVSTTFHGVIK